jgi:hypothetical protein
VRTKEADPFFATQLQSVVNRSSPTAELIELAKDPSNLLTGEFEALWSATEARLIATAEANDNSAYEELEFLLAALPVVHVDAASMYYMHEGSPLIERCAFKVVAESVATHFPAAVPWIKKARKALESPEAAPERLLGYDGDADVQRLLTWIEGGKLEADVVLPPDEDPTDPEFHAWLEMMTNHHACMKDGTSAFSSLDEAEDEEAASEGTAETLLETSAEDEVQYQSVEDASGSAESRSIDDCYEAWQKSAAAAALKEFLDTQL